MLNIERKPDFIKKIRKITHNKFKKRLINQVRKIVEKPEIGKPMKHARKGTRKVYIKPYRIAYAYIKKENKLIFLELYHKDEQ